MNERCKHIGKDGHRCGSYAFNLYKDDVEQGDLCDVHYWQTKAQRKPLTDEEIEKCYETTRHYQTLRPQDRFAVFALARAIEAAHGIKE